MKTRLLVIVGLVLLPFAFPQGFSQCIYNEDWPDAPCFDMGPVSHFEFYMGWAPYYDHKGSEWMETKRIELQQAIEQGILEEWVEKIENHNVYQYYLSTNEIQSHLPQDRYFVNLEPNFLTSGGSVNLDPELAPSFSQDFVWYKFLTPLVIPISIISSLFVGTFVVLKLKKISSRPYLSLELAGLLLFFGIPNLVSSLGFLPIIISQPEQIRPYIFEQIFVTLWVPTVALSIAGILLYRSSVIRKLIR